MAKRFQKDCKNAIFIHSQDKIILSTMSRVLRWHFSGIIHDLL